jgi:hypothetical protein
MSLPQLQNTHLYTRWDISTRENRNPILQKGDFLWERRRLAVASNQCYLQRQWLCYHCCYCCSIFVPGRLRYMLGILRQRWYRKAGESMWWSRGRESCELVSWLQLTSFQSISDWCAKTNLLEEFRTVGRQRRSSEIGAEVVLCCGRYIWPRYTPFKAQCSTAKISARFRTWPLNVKIKGLSMCWKVCRGIYGAVCSPPNRGCYLSNQDLAK